MKTSLLHLSSLAVVATMFTGCFTSISGPDGGYIAAGAGPRRAGVVVDPPGPGAVAVGTTAPRRRVYADERVVVRQQPAVIVIPRNSPRVVYRGQSAYYWNGNYYRRSRGGYVIIR